MRRYFGRQSLSRALVSSGGRPQCPLLPLVVEAGAVTCTNFMPRQGMAQGGTCQAPSQAALRW
jgi:hypothetical protein